MSILLKNNETLMKEFNYDKNENVNLDKITTGSNKRIWWKCAKGHEWVTSPNHRLQGRGCPYCSGHKVLKGYNDIFTTHPFLRVDWDYDKNSIDPMTLSAGSNKKVFWLCNKGHSYITRVSHRVSGSSCPYCAGNRILRGYNDLETWCKKNNNKVLEKWDYVKNKKKPFEFSRTSSEKVWWKCNICGFEYKNSIEYETVNIYCPQCSKRNQTSFPEQVLFYYLKKIFPDAINAFHTDSISELDIYIPSKKIGIEYDGENWHKGKKSIDRELRKYKMCRNEGIKLIRFKEKSYKSDVPVADIIYKSSYNISIKKFEEEISEFLGIFSQNIQVDIENDRNKIMSQYMSIIRNNSLSNKYSNIAKEWDYDKNYPIQPSMVSANSNLEFYFKCKKGHSYKKSISKRVNRGDGCPICSGRKVLKGFNDLATTNPEFLDEWDYKKNKIQPTEVSSGSNLKVWWIGKCGHEWEATINSRVLQHNGCKYCNGGIGKKVNQYDMNGNYIATYDSCGIAAKKLNLHHANISRSCTNKKTCGGYQWRYLSDNYPINKNIKKYNNIFNNKIVSQYSKNGVLIRTFMSVTMAEKVTGIKSIGEVCNGKRKSAGGFVWKFQKDEQNRN